MTTLLQISDPHFGSEVPGACDALVRLAQELAPELVVLSGDITQRAQRDEFRAAREFIGRIGDPPLLAIPGNHDIPLFNVALRLWRPYANYAREFGANLEPTFSSRSWRVIGVKTTRRYRHKQGEVSGAQVSRVAGELARADAAQLRIVVLHHPVQVERADDDENVLRGHAEAVREWASAGADLILGGHIHLPYVSALHERRQAMPRNLWAVQAGTAVSSRIRREAPQSVNVIRAMPSALSRSCIVERWDYSLVRNSFAQVSAVTLECSP